MGKLTSELMVNEYTRRGWIDGRILRLPTIVVRPGVPSNATSAFLSGSCFNSFSFPSRFINFPQVSFVNL